MAGQEIIEMIKASRVGSVPDEQVLSYILNLETGIAGAVLELQQAGVKPRTVVDQIIKASDEQSQGSQSEADLDKLIESRLRDLYRSKISSKRRAQTANSQDDWRIKLAKLKSGRFWRLLLSIMGYPVIGLDISDRAISIVYLSRKNNRLKARQYWPLPPGLVENGEIIKQKALIDQFRQALAATSPVSLNIDSRTAISAVVSFPESLIYTQYFTVDSNKKLKSQIKAKIKQSIPEPIDNLDWDYVQAQDTETDQVKVSVVAASKEKVNSYIHFLRSTGVVPITPIAFASGPLAAVEVIDEFKKPTRSKAKESLLLLDIRAGQTVIHTIDRHRLPVTSVVALVGFEQLLDGVGSGSAEPVEDFENRFEQLVTEIKQSLDFFSEQTSSKLTQFILSAPQPVCQVLNDRLAAELELKSVSIDLMQVLRIPSQVEQLSPEYLTAVGLALRAAGQNPVTAGVNLLPSSAKARERARYSEETRSFLIFAVISAVLGLSILAGVIYFFTAFPKPVPMQPLIPRALLQNWLSALFPSDDESSLVGNYIQITAESTDEMRLFNQPDPEAQTLEVELTADDAWPVLAEQNGWLQLELSETETGWLQEEFAQLSEAQESVE